MVKLKPRMNRVKKISGRLVIVLMMKWNSLLVMILMMLVLKVIRRKVWSRKVNVTSVIAHLGGQHCQPTGRCSGFSLINNC